MQDNRTLLNRTVLLSLLLLFWFCVILGRLFQLQVVDHAELKEKAEQQQEGFFEVTPKRGDILDRKLEPLAVSVAVESIFSDPSKVKDARLAAGLLAPILGMDGVQLEKKLSSLTRFVYLKRKVPPKEAEQVRQLDLEGIHFQKETKRIYPHKELAAHVLGFVGLDNEGLSGIEYFLDKQIKGSRGRIFIRQDARRQVYQGFNAAEGTEGNVVILTLDRDLQFIAEQELRRGVQEHHAASGAAIVMDPATGDILAMASWPEFNPNRFSDSPAENRRNRSILEVYEPGSTFKIITASAAIAERVVRPSEILDCKIGTVALGGKIFREAKHSFGLLSFSEIIEKSSNVGTIKLGLRLGEDRLYSYIRRFGFGQRTGVELPAEEVGLLRRPSEWSKLSIGAISIGQEVGVTPLQLLAAVSAVANGGTWVRPRIFDRVLNPAGDVVRSSVAERREILPPESARIVAEALQGVVERGTGTLALPDGYSAAGKTGTAQKFINGAYSRTRYVASFVGFAPAERPALAAIVMINEPAGTIWGGAVAAPVFKAMMERALLHMKVPKTRPAAWQLQAAARDPAAQQAEAEESEQAAISETIAEIIEQEGWKTHQERDETLVTVELKEGAVQVPDFTGKSLREVVRQCGQLRLNLKASGSGVAVGQRPVAGVRAIPQTTCEVFFALKNRP